MVPQFILGFVMLGLSLTSMASDRKNVFLDAHLHLSSLTPRVIDQQIIELKKRYNIQKGFLISPSYLFEPTFDVLLKDYEILQERSNQALAHTLKNNSNFLSGLCGVTHLAPNFIEFASKCRKIPGVIGYKFRLSWYQEFDKYEETMDTFFSELPLKNNLILVHIPEYGGELKYYQTVLNSDRNEVDKNESKKEFDKSWKQAEYFVDWLLKKAKENPNSQIVLAHGAGFPKILENFSVKMQAQNISNVWVEYSGFADYVPAIFPIERILFGSDMAIGDGTDYIASDSEESVWKSNSGFFNHNFRQMSHSENFWKDISDNSKELLKRLGL